MKINQNIRYAVGRFEMNTTELIKLDFDFTPKRIKRRNSNEG